MDSKNIRIIFCIPKNCQDEQSTSEEMQQAFEACKQNGIQIQWTSETDIKVSTLNKTDIVVFENFNGGCFEKLQNTKSVRIVGPWCLLTCLTQGISIPNFPWPIYSVAMRNCTVSSSALTKVQRKDIQTKIQQMGGYYSSDLVTACTNLVTDSVKSEKYVKAAEIGLKIVLPSWVYEVWDASTKGIIHCNEDQFLNKHRCPAFYKLVICCTGFNCVQRTELSKLVEGNGGLYKEQLHMSTTDILVCSSGSASNKYLAAKKRNIKCVNFDWVKDSVKNGYAMPDTNYPVKVNTSTPTKDAQFFPPNFSMISNIGIGNVTSMVNPNDTVEATLNITDAKQQSSRKRKINNEHNELVDEISMQNVKMAGPFLDGCGIYFAGFGLEQREKLCKILNFGGATRYDEISERVTHIIVGDHSCYDKKLLGFKDHLKNVPIVNIQWLLDSIIAEHPVNEEKYIINANGLTKADSPLSKKGLHVLQQNKSEERIPNIPMTQSAVEEEVDVAKQYLRNATSLSDDTLAKLLQDEEPNTIRDQDRYKPSISNQKMTSKSDGEESLSSAVDDSSQASEPIFQGLKFVIAGFSESACKPVKQAIESMQGKVMSKSYKGIADYAVVPVFGKELLSKPTTHVVTDLWVTECWQENEIRPIEYFHKPILVKDVKPLMGCVITISNYVHYERNFLTNLIKELGGICQEQLSKISCPKTGIVKCTHLVIPNADATGKKYTAAVRWKLFIVNKDWVLECAQTSKRQLENLHAVGEPERISATSLAVSVSSLKLQTPSKDVSKPAISSVTKSKSSILTQSMFGNNSPFQEDMQQDYNNAVADASEDCNKTSKIMVEGMNKDLTSHKISDSSSITPLNRVLAEARRKTLSGSFVKTPLRVLQNVQNISGVSSSMTPVHNIRSEAKKADVLGTPERPPYYKPWNNLDTPDTPLGAFIRPDPSPNLRKEMLMYLNTIPDRRTRRVSTPLSEIKRKLWDKICPPRDLDDVNQDPPVFDAQDEETSQHDEFITPTKTVPEDVVADQLQHLHDMLTSSSRLSSVRSERKSTIPVPSTEVKGSQPNTVGWDDCMECDIVQPKEIVPIFMISGLEAEQRQTMTTKLENLGALVIESNRFDLNCTHLICPKPARNEKTLAAIAAGKWILHSLYVDKCSEEGILINEEPYEFGNPKSIDNLQTDKENQGRFSIIHYWRKEIARRGYGPFYDMKAIVVSKKRESLVCILKAGGAMVVDAEPPFSDKIHATHCIIDTKSITDLSVFIPLAKRGIYVVNAVFVSDYLHRTVHDARDALITSLAKYY